MRQTPVFNIRKIIVKIRMQRLSPSVCLSEWRNTRRKKRRIFLKACFLKALPEDLLHSGCTWMKKIIFQFLQDWEMNVWGLSGSVRIAVLPEQVTGNFQKSR
jgi:hypothetical protein